MPMQLSTVHIAASPLRMAAARLARSGRSHEETTAGPTRVSGALARASRVRTRSTQLSMEPRPLPDRASAGEAASAAVTSTAMTHNLTGIGTGRRLGVAGKGLIAGEAWRPGRTL